MTKKEAKTKRGRGRPKTGVSYVPKLALLRQEQWDKLYALKIMTDESVQRHLRKAVAFYLDKNGQT